MNDPDLKWLTYPELGKALGIASASAKRLAIRRRWPKRPGNDGRARVGVPIEAIPIPAASDIAGDDTSGAAGDVTSDDTGAVIAAVTALQRHIERLERELEALKSERDAERAVALSVGAQVGALQATLAAVGAERDRLADQVKAALVRHATVPSVPASRGLLRRLFG